MTRTTNSGCGVVRLDDKRGQVGLSEKGIIIATNEDKIAVWMRELLAPCMRRLHVLMYAATTEAFDLLARMPGMVMAFIEIGFFGEAMLVRLDRLRKLFPYLRIVLFSVSCMPSDEIARYAHWSGSDCFISLRDKPERIEERLKCLFEGRDYIPEDVLSGMRDYERLSGIPPYLTRQEIEIVRFIAQEKTDEEITNCLRVSIKTLNNHLGNIYRKFGIRNRVGILKLAVATGILPERELMAFTVLSVKRSG